MTSHHRRPRPQPDRQTTATRSRTAELAGLTVAWLLTALVAAAVLAVSLRLMRWAVG